MTFDRPGIANEQFGRIRPGWEIIGADGNKIGTVANVEADYFVVSQGFIFTSERYIPAPAVREIEPGQVVLSVTGDEIEQYGWDSPQAIQTAFGRGDEPDTRDVTQGERTAEDSEHLELREEEVSARKNTVESGEVDVSKDVVTEREEFDVPRKHEEVDVTYRPAAEHRPAEGEIGDEEEIRVPLHEEDVQVEKETVVSGEVDIDKREVEDEEHISEEVRKERLRVEREGDVHINESEMDEERNQ